MKKKTKKKLKILAILSIFIVFSINITECFNNTEENFDNSSDYKEIRVDKDLRDSFFNTPYSPINDPKAETPDLPEFYNFYDGPNIRYGIFLKSHYGTHDWIADAALRFLINENQQGAEDWEWLLSDDTINDLEWKDDYSDSNDQHFTQRSYILFLFATQFPDSDYYHKGSQPRPNKHMEYIDLWEKEGEIIGNNKYGTGSWVGKTSYQTFHWKVKEDNTGDFYDVGTQLYPKPMDYHYSPQKAPWYASKMGEAALKCLANNETDPEDGKSKRYSKVESGACWLGAMSHYIADLASIPHLIYEGEGYYPSSPKFHGWFEFETTKQTVWDIDNRGPYGYFNPPFEFFDINPLIINEDANKILPLEPGLAAQEMAWRGINQSYGGIHENGLYLRQGYSSQEALINTWIWEDNNRLSNSPVVSGGISYVEYYDKVEKLLNYAIYLTARAMKWIMNEVKKKGGIDPNNYAINPYIELYPGEQKILPGEVPKNQQLGKDANKQQKQFLNINSFGIMVSIAIATPILGSVFSYEIMKIVKEKELLKKKY